MSGGQQATVQVRSGIVKQVLSGDAVVIRNQPRSGPPQEKILAMSNVIAPRLARRPNLSADASTSGETKDEPYAWESREFLRKMVVGKEVTFAVDHKAEKTGREYGSLWVNKGGEQVNVVEQMLSEGLVEVRTGSIKQTEEMTRLSEFESQAKTAGRGKWNKEKNPNAVRNIIWNVDNLRNFVDKNHGKELDAVIEHVRDGCTVRAFLLPDFIYVTLMLSGVKCPMFRRDDSGKESAEQFAEMARFFTESRLLQRDVKIILEGVSNQNNALGTVIHPNGNITEFLLREGFARCVDWSMGVVTQGREKLRQAEKSAKEKQLRIWKDYQPPVLPASVPIKTKEFIAKVMEVVNGDALVVKTSEGQSQKIFFSSLRPPRPKTDDSQDATVTERHAGQKSRPLYDVPYMFEAREFLRKKLIGKKVNIVVDYIRPANDDFSERMYCSINREGINIAEALISKGLATVVRHRADDDQRSSQYDELLSAEARAIKNSKGLHSRKEYPLHRVADISGDATKAKQFLPFLQRSGKTTAIVEFVASGSRVRLFLPKDTCLITFLLAGVSCPRAPLANPRAGQSFEPEKYGQEALQFTKELILQREVEVEVESTDKGGNFVGWMWVDGKNLSLILVQEGLSKVHFTADRSQYAGALYSSEDQAKQAKKKVWEDFVEGQEDEVEEEQDVVDDLTVDRVTDYKEIIVTEVDSGNHFYSQFVDQGPNLESLMNEMRQELATNPPLAGSFVPKKGAKCIAQFTDGLWYRGVVEAVPSRTEVQVFYSDFGNRGVVSPSKIAALPSKYSSLPPQATEYFLACSIVPEDEDWAKEALKGLKNEVLDQTMLLNVEYKIQGQQYVSLMTPGDNGKDIISELLEEGLLRVEKNRRCSSKLIGDYIKAEEKARKARRNIWCYGDFTPDDAKEFGYKKQ
ncbi:staphylococcal nuclease domain-containing protein 1-like [Dysidea avara]|uniref:staphylococcal nuclease domain-containing protein 1-like n=1 Tax=Dysidea avara TaxID=196820 RepID=UPI003317EC02